jgi:hypothetical protein
MNRFVYLVHADYRSAMTQAVAPRSDPQGLLEKLARLRAELRRQLPDANAQIAEEAIRRDPDVVQMTVVTTLEETAADSAFVRFIRSCSATALLD